MKTAKRAVTVEHFEKMEQRVKELEAELERLRAELEKPPGNWQQQRPVGAVS